MRYSVKGLATSSGIAIGPLWIYHPIHISVDQKPIGDAQAEWQRIETALAMAKSQLETLQAKALEMCGTAEAEIFQAHALFLEDPELLGLLKEAILSQKENAEYGVNQVVEHYAQMLLALEGEYFRARATDVRDVGRRILYCLAGIRLEDISLPDQPVIIVSEDLTPSDTVQFDRNKILGFCTVKGGPTSHTAILARSIGVPAVVSAPLPMDKIQNGTIMVLNGSTGEIGITPDEAELEVMRKKQAEGQTQWTKMLEAAQNPAVTYDGKKVEVVANIGSAQDARQAVKNGAEGVGLLRTEFLYLDRQSLPTEDEQVAIYSEIFEVMGDRPVVVRTLDIGGDKSVSYLGIEAEANPFLGWRAIRMISERPEILRDQLRALLRAGINSDLRIMLPMVSNLEEVEMARAIYDEARQSLLNEGKTIAQKVQFGMMIEVPSAALIASHLAELVDFFSIGTNDLTQYTIAIDRTNERVAKLASPFHPAVIALIAHTIRAAHAKGKWVGLCGEMAGDPLGTPLLLGLGLDEFSMAPKSIPAVKQLLRSLNSADCEKIAEHALTLSTTAKVEAFLKESVSNL
ncbi:MAG: phosphoenolpyruvate--protein phosphotransferase [Anaerolineae bacterium]|nr:phosphoenolpyruvate--protein phosphotransferase [Anaerolineae bacterium]